MPKLNSILETVLYVEDLERGDAFYRETLGVTRIHSDFRMRGYGVGSCDVLLLFAQGGSLHTIETPGGIIEQLPDATHGLHHERPAPVNDDPINRPVQQLLETLEHELPASQQQILRDEQECGNLD